MTTKNGQLGAHSRPMRPEFLEIGPRHKKYLPTILISDSVVSLVLFRGDTCKMWKSQKIWLWFVGASGLTDLQWLLIV